MRAILCLPQSLIYTLSFLANIRYTYSHFISCTSRRISHQLKTQTYETWISVWDLQLTQQEGLNFFFLLLTFGFYVYFGTHFRWKKNKSKGKAHIFVVVEWHLSLFSFVQRVLLTSPFSQQSCTKLIFSFAHFQSPYKVKVVSVFYRRAHSAPIDFFFFFVAFFHVAVSSFLPG